MPIRQRMQQDSAPYGKMPKKRKDDFKEYHCSRGSTRVYFRCEHCPLRTELVNWLYVPTFRKWCLHLDKFHKCGQRKTVRFSKRALPHHAKNWPTISHETAKKLLQDGMLTKFADAPAPGPLCLQQIGTGDYCEMLECHQEAQQASTGEDTVNERNLCTKATRRITSETTEEGNSCDESSQFDSFDELIDNLDLSPFTGEVALGSADEGDHMNTDLFAALDTRGFLPSQAFSIHKQIADQSAKDPRQLRFRQSTTMASRNDPQRQGGTPQIFFENLSNCNSSNSRAA